MAAVPDHIRDPAEIYRQSFEMIRREADLSRYSNGLEDIAVRLIHACGMIDIVDDLVMSSDAATAGKAALRHGRPIVCDVEMVRKGIIRRLLPDGLPVLCGLSDERTEDLAQKLETTRSAAAFEVLSQEIAGGIVAIGNAPTALFRLLELVADGATRPALVLGFPVGFVGAAESKAALAQNTHGIPFMTLAGRRGGSAIAAAALNALILGGRI